MKILSPSPVKVIQNVIENLVRCIVYYVDVWTPLEISLKTLRVILGVCLNKVFFNYY